MRSRFLILSLTLIVAGCINQSGIQSRYTREHDECRSYAESHIDQSLPKEHSVSPEGRNAQLVTLFSDCMDKKGWQVAKPKRPDDTAANTGNAIPPSPSPAAAPAPPAQNAVPQPAPGTPTAPLASSPNPAQPTDTSGVATYSPTYGSGPGRQF